MNFVRYTHDWTSAVGRFNQRLLAGGLEPELVFPEEPKADFPSDASAPLHQEFILLVDGLEVRGGYFLTYETWRVNETLQEVCNYRLPVAESLVNRAYRGLGRALVRDAAQRSPFLYCLGMGDVRRPLPKLLKSENWPMMMTPFYFRCVRPSRILRNLSYLRNKTAWRMVMDAAEGKLSAGLIKGWQKLWSSAPTVAVKVEMVPDFGNWTDEIWQRTRVAYRVLAVRDQKTLRMRYPAGSSRFLRLIVSAGSTVVGWAVLLNTAMTSHRHFGDLRVGTIVDCLALPGMERSIVHAAAGTLEEGGVDLIVSNQSHRSWKTGLQRCGFFQGPSNRIFAVSPALAQRLHPLRSQFPFFHFTRGDAAGPIHL